MQRSSVLYDHYVAQSNGLIENSDSISPLRASIDPRFSSLLERAANHRERFSQQQISPLNPVHSSSIATVNSNAWSPTETSKEELINTPKKSCLSSTWKSRLQGLLIGLAIAAISTGTILGVLLTTNKSSANSTTSTQTTTPAPACSSLQWSVTSVSVAGAGTSGTASNQFYYPLGIYVDSSYNIYVADQSNHRVQQWPPNATTGITVAGVTGVPGSNASLLDNPSAIYVDSQQNLYIGDNYGISVWSLNASVGTRISSSVGFGSIYAIYVDKNGNIYANIASFCVVRMWTSITATSSTVVAGGTSCGFSSSQFYTFYGMTVNSLTNTIYVSNNNAQTIVAWPIGATNGTIIAGRNSTYGTTSFLLNCPRDIKQDPYGNLYVADTCNSRILLFCQNPPSTSAVIIAGYPLSNPYSIALDSNLNLYVLNNNQVQMYTRIV